MSWAELVREVPPSERVLGGAFLLVAVGVSLVASGLMATVAAGLIERHGRR